VIRCILFTNEHSWISYDVLKRLYEDTNVEIVSVFLYRLNDRKKLRKKITKYGIIGLLKKALLIGGNKINNFSYLLGFKTVFNIRTSYNFLIKNQIPFQIFSDFNVDEVKELIIKLSVDYIVTCSFSQILKPILLDIPNLKFINIHNSLLPAHKGPSPSFWILYHNENETGYTVHEINNRIDEGTIIYQESFDCKEIKSEEELIRISYYKASLKICDIMKMLMKNQKIKFSLSQKSESYENYPSIEQQKKLQKKLKEKSRRRNFSYNKQP
jgi:methionyl-tRNA formyltransferase